MKIKWKKCKSSVTSDFTGDWNGFDETGCNKYKIETNGNEVQLFLRLKGFTFKYCGLEVESTKAAKQKAQEIEDAVFPNIEFDYPVMRDNY